MERENSEGPDTEKERKKALREKFGEKVMPEDLVRERIENLPEELERHPLESEDELDQIEAERRKKLS